MRSKSEGHSSIIFHPPVSKASKSRIQTAGKTSPSLSIPYQRKLSDPRIWSQNMFFSLLGIFYSVGASFRRPNTDFRELAPFFKKSLELELHGSSMRPIEILPGSRPVLRELFLISCCFGSSQTHGFPPVTPPHTH